MARFLSPDWFAEVARVDGPAADAGPDPLVLEQVVTGGPDGDVRYFVVVTDGSAHIHTTSPAGPGGTALTITSDWATAAAIAQGRLSTQRALMEGRLRVRGSPGRLSGRLADLTGADPVPASVRRQTTY